MKIQDFQTQQIPHAPEAMRVQDFQTQEGYSANENAGFPDTTKTTCYQRSTTQC